MAEPRRLEPPEDTLRDAPTLVEKVGRTRVQAVLNAPRKHKSQPLASILLSRSSGGSRDWERQVLVNTEIAIREAYRSSTIPNKWFDARLEVAADCGDFSSAAAALGELRGAGMLVEAGLTVVPRPTKKDRPSADLNVSVRALDQSSEEAVVEIHSPQMTGEEARNLEKFNQHFELAKGHTVGFSEHVSVPFGRPKGKEGAPPENTTLNVVYRFCKMKQDSKQADPAKPFVLWLDLQDQDMGVLDPTYLSPVLSWRGEFSGGPLWLAFYGKKGLPVLQKVSLQAPYEDETVPMSFQGRFRADRQLSGVVLSLPRTTAVFENPRALHPMPQGIVSALLGTRWMDLPRSWLSWPSGQRHLRCRIALARRDIRLLYKDFLRVRASLA